MNHENVGFSAFFSIFFKLYLASFDHLPISLENSPWVGTNSNPNHQTPWPSRSSSASDPTLSTGVFQALWRPHGPGTTQGLMGWAGWHYLGFFVGGFLLKLHSFPTVTVRGASPKQNDNMSIYGCVCFNCLLYIYILMLVLVYSCTVHLYLEHIDTSCCRLYKHMPQKKNHLSNFYVFSSHPSPNKI